MSVRMVLRALGVGDILDVRAAGYADNSISPSNAQKGIRYQSDGLFTQQNDGGAFTGSAVWITPQVNMATYSIRATITSGTLSAGSDVDGVWLALTADRTFTKLRTSDVPGTDTVTLTIELARTADTSTVLASGTVSISATVV